MNDKTCMSWALDICRKGIERGQSPFGACIVRDGEVLSCEHNAVWLQSDITAHAEIQALRSACRKIRALHLVGATIYSTTEPCPMCFAAIHWARVDRIVYGTSIEDSKRYGFNELEIPNLVLKETGGCKLELVPSVLREECLHLFEDWHRRGGKAY